MTFVINQNGKVRSLNNWSEQGTETFMRNFAHLGNPPATAPGSPEANFRKGLFGFPKALSYIQSFDKDHLIWKFFSKA